MEDAPVYTCPHCDEPVAVDPADLSEPVLCPHCNNEFIASNDPPEEDPRQDELDGLRVRQITAIRRADIRTRSYFIVIAIGCIAGAAQCLFNAFHIHQPPRRITLLLSIAAALILIARFAIRKAAKIARELNKPLLEDPQTPPDFSQLRDGSQLLTHLQSLSVEEQPPTNDAPDPSPQTTPKP